MAGEVADVLVVGGGPAGLATAIRARTQGLDTLLIDPGYPPIDRACGEGLMPDACERLRQLEVVIPEGAQWRFRGIRYIDGETVADGRFRGAPGVGVRRIDLHGAMCRRAEEAGVRLRWGVRALGLAADGVDTDQGVMRATWLVAADGRTSRIRGWSGLDGRTARRGRLGIRRHYRIAPWCEFVEVYWSMGAEAYVTPIGESTVGVAMLFRGEGEGFDQLLDRFPALRQRLAGVPQASRDRGAGPFGQWPRAVVRHRLALVGDASGCLDPITGEGLAAAFHQAFAVVAAISRGDLSRYAEAHRRIMRLPRLLTGALLQAERRPRQRLWLFRALASSPAIFDGLLDLRTRRSLGANGALSLVGTLAGHRV